MIKFHLVDCSLNKTSLFVIPTAPVFYFGETEYHVDESDGYVEVRVWRTGSDLSKTGTVTVRSRKTEPVSAEGMYQTDCVCQFPVLHVQTLSYIITVNMLIDLIHYLACISRNLPWDNDVLLQAPQASTIDSARRQEPILWFTDEI